MPINKGTKTEQIDPRVLEILGLQDVFDFTYAEYLTLLKGKMAEARMTKSSISTERTELLTKEYKRVKNKEGQFKVKKKKISSANVSNNLKVSKPLKALPPGKMVGGDGAIVKYVEQQNKTLGDIEKTLKTGVKNEEKRSKEKRRVAAQVEDKRKKVATEKVLESGPDFSTFQKLAAPIVKPVEDLFNRILKFLGLTFAGFVLDKTYKWWTNPSNQEKVQKIQNFFSSVGDWFNDENNQKKIGTLVKFLKDHWVALFGIGGLLLLYNNSFFRFGVKLTGLLTKSIIRLGLLTGKLLAKAAALGWKGAVAGAGLLGKGLRGGARALKGLKGVRGAKPPGPIQQVTVRDVTPRPALGPEIKPIGLLPPAKGPMPMGPESPLDIINPFNRGGMVPVHLTKGEYVVPPKQAQRIGYSNLERINAVGNYNRGGNIQPQNNEFNVGGLIPGRGPNIDTVRTSLPSGSFVIQRPAVDRIGAGNLSRLGFNGGGQVGGPDWWSLVAVASREDGDPQAWADVAQSIYNRQASGAYGGGNKSIKGLITSTWQYEPTWRYPKGAKLGAGKPNSEWLAISDIKTASAASDQSEGALRNVSNALLNSTYQQKAKELVQGRTDFTGYPKSNRRGQVQRKSGDNYFGWDFNYSQNKIAGFPSFKGGTATMTASTEGTSTGSSSSSGSSGSSGSGFDNIFSEFGAFQKLANVLIGEGSNKGGRIGYNSGGKVVEYLTGDKSHSGYRSDHGGGNYHEHLAFATVDQRDRAMALLKQNGIQIGSINTGRHAPGSYHYSNLAFDVPAAQVPVGQEPALSKKVRSILSSGGFVGQGIGTGEYSGRESSEPGAGTQASTSGADFFSMLNPYTSLLSKIEDITGAPIQTTAEIKTNIPDKISKVSTTSPSSMKKGGQIAATLAPLPSSVIKQGPKAGSQGNINPKRDSDTSVKSSPPNDSSNTFEWGYEKVFGIMGV